jgi:hypothetical protein
VEVAEVVEEVVGMLQLPEEQWWLMSGYED